MQTRGNKKMKIKIIEINRGVFSVEIGKSKFYCNKDDLLHLASTAESAFLKSNRSEPCEI